MSAREQPSGRKRARSISDELATGFGAVSVMSVLMCLLLLTQIQQAGSAVTQMRADEESIRQSAQLATAIREQYVHLAHAIIEGDGSHLDHQAGWSNQVMAHVAWLRANGPPGQSARLDSIETSSARVARLLREEIVPALDSRDEARIAGAHQEIELLVEDASHVADELAMAVGQRMVGAHVDATRATRIGFGSGLVCVAMILFLSGFFTLRLRRSVIAPLGTLAEAAGELGRGNFDVRLGRIGHGELQVVASAFDHMVGELADREQQLRRTERMAAIGQLAAGVAHELNNPIGIIRGYLKTLDLTGDLEEVRAELAIIDDEAVACQRIADDLLAYSRTPELQRRRTRVHELVAETAARIQNAGLAGKCALTFDAEPAEIDIDAARIRQVVTNLVRNAVQASPVGSPITIEGRVRPMAYEIRISDRGSGVAVEDSTRIFEPFFSRRGGSGLGLAVVHGLVSSHGGTISVEQRLGGGSVFVVALPHGDVAAAESGEVAP